MSWYTVVGCFICEGCGTKAKTPNGLPSIQWRKVDGHWYCGDCAHGTRPG